MSFRDVQWTLGSHGGEVEVDGGHLIYQEAGRGFPVILIHGFSFDLRLWTPQVAPFAHQRRVIRYDARGFGGATLPDSPYRPVDDLIKLMNHLGIARVDLVGASMGGGIAADFALAYPDRLRALVLVGATINGFPWSDDSLERFRLYSRTAREQGIDAARELWLHDPMFTRALAASRGSTLLQQMIDKYSGWHWTHRDPGVSPEPPAAGRLNDIHSPTLVIVGEHDLPEVRQTADLLTQDILGAELVVLPDAGHLPNIEVPGAFNETVLRFLARLDAEAAPSV